MSITQAERCSPPGFATERRKIAVNCGLDYGTSNTAIGLWRANEPVIVPLEGEEGSMPSVMYTQKAAVGPASIDPEELDRRVAAARAVQSREMQKAKDEGRKHVELSEERLRSMELGRLRREAAESAAARSHGQSLSEALSMSEGDLFGQAAFRKYLLSPEDGFFFKSPKTFLGSKLGADQLDSFSEITTRMIARVKSLAETWSGSELRKVVIGRPVNFHGTLGEAGNAQALSILERAAVACGFDSVEFLHEPVAAALDYERSLAEDRIVLVVDLGGGTADCSMVSVGPGFRDKLDRSGSILGYSGDRIGGNDLDIKLAFRELMKEFGRTAHYGNGLPVPAILFLDAVSTNDLPAQARFRSAGRQIQTLLASVDQPGKLGRLATVHRRNLSHRVVRSAEFAKIQLSDHEAVDVPMDYIEDNFTLRVSRSQFAEAIGSELQKFRGLIDECRSQAGRDPDVVYVTGGTARSPVVRGLIERSCPGLPIVVGDLFGSVASGLATWSNRIHGIDADLQGAAGGR